MLDHCTLCILNKSDLDKTCVRPLSLMLYIRYIQTKIVIIFQIFIKSDSYKTCVIPLSLILYIYKHQIILIICNLGLCWTIAPNCCYDKSSMLEAY